MDIFLLIIGVIFCLIGIVGSFLPILPGPIASWFGLLILHFTSYVSFSFWFLTITFLIAFLIGNFGSAMKKIIEKKLLKFSIILSIILILFAYLVYKFLINFIS